MPDSVATRRLCLVIDVAGYGETADPTQIALQRRLDDVLTRSLAAAGVALERTWRQPQGGRQLVLLPVGLDEAHALPLLIRGLLQHVDRDNQRSPATRMRLRASITQGAVTRGPTGYVGRAVMSATRLLDGEPIRRELQERPSAALALIVSDDVYGDVLVHGHGNVPADGFRRVVVELAGGQWRAEAWIRAWDPGSLEPLPNRRFGALRDAVAAAPGAVPQLLDDIVAKSRTDADPVSQEIHEAEVEVVDHVVEDHTYVVQSYGEGTYVVAEHGEHAEFTSAGYESADVSEDSS